MSPSSLALPGGRLAYDDVGAGPAVVCLHGMGDTRAAWRHVVPGLVGAGFRVVCLDLRGHGDSDVAFDRYDPAAVGADVLAVLDALDLRCAALVANSASAASAVWAAAEAPDRIAGLGLVGPVVRNPPGRPSDGVVRMLAALLGRPLFAGVWRWFYGTLFKGGVPEDHDVHLARVAAAAREPGRLFAALRHGMDDKTPCAARLPEVSAPAVIVMGDADPDFPDAAAEAREVGALLGAPVTLLEGVGHYPHMERPDTTTSALLAFLEGLSCRAA